MMVLTSVVSPCKQQLGLWSQGVLLLCFTGEKVLNVHSCRADGAAPLLQMKSCSQAEGQHRKLFRWQSKM